MNAKQKKAVLSKLDKQLELVHQQYWPGVHDWELWNRKKNDGYTTIPRAMPQIMAIIDALADKGKPASQAYLMLWFRIYDLHMQVHINSPGQLAVESGFGGERAVSSWQSRMQKLVELGFIKAAKGNEGPYEFVLVMNPYYVIHQLDQAGRFDTQNLQKLLIDLRIRAVKVGAKDLEQIAAGTHIPPAPPPPAAAAVFAVPPAPLAVAVAPAAETPPTIIKEGG